MADAPSEAGGRAPGLTDVIGGPDGGESRGEASTPLRSEPAALAAGVRAPDDSTAALAAESCASPPRDPAQKKLRRRRRNGAKKPAASPADGVAEARDSPAGEDDAPDADALQDFLRSRPPIERLMQQNIIRDAQADGLRRAAAASELGRRLSVRPSAEELLDKNVLKASAASPAIAAVRASVSKQQHRDHLARSLRRKPALDELVRRNIYRPEEMERGLGGSGGIGAGVSLQLQVAVLNELMRKRPPLDQLVVRAELSKRVMMWTQMPDVRGAPPHPRNCHSCTLVGQRLFVAGGFEEPPDPPCLPLAALDLDAPAWQHPGACVGARGFLLPSPRYAHSAVAFADAFLVVFGGYGAGRWLNDLWLADVRPDATAATPPATPAVASAAHPGAAAASVRPRASPDSAGASSGGSSSGGGGWPSLVTWHATTPGGPQPPPRAAHSAVVCDGCMVVFGGNDGAGLFNDAWMMPLSEALLEWRPVTHVGPPPSPRSGHSCVLHGAEMLVFGGGEGWGGHCFNDLHCGHVDIERGRIAWVRPSFTGTPPPPRAGHSASIVGDRMFVFGGGDARRALNDLHVLDLGGMAWSRPSDTGVLPQPRGSHSAAAVGTFIAIFGGANPDGLNFNDLHLLDTAYSPYGDVEEGGAGATADAASEPRPGPRAAARRLVTQSDNESGLSTRVLTSRLGGDSPAAATRAAVRSLGTLRSSPEVPLLVDVAQAVPHSGSSSAPADQRNPIQIATLLAALPPRSPPHVMTIAARACGSPSPAAAGASPSASAAMLADGGSSAADLRGQLSAALAALQRSDDERFAQLQAQLEGWRDGRRAELATLRGLLERM